MAVSLIAPALIVVVQSAVASFSLERLGRRWLPRAEIASVIAINGSRGQTSPPPRGSAQDSAQNSAQNSAKGQTSPPPRLLCLIWISRRVAPLA